MANVINLLVFLSSVIGIVAVAFGIDISRKVVGKLKTLLIFLVLTISIFTFGEIVGLLNILLSFGLTYSNEWISLLLAVFFLITVIIVKSVVEELEKINVNQKETKKIRVTKKTRTRLKNGYLDLTK